MNLRDLRYLVALKEHGHFGRAAEACFVSQPTLSTQLKKLEETLGVVLIERTNRQVMFTSVGEQIVEQARRVLRELGVMVNIAEQHRDPFGGDFRLGLIPTIAPFLLPRILDPIRKEFPSLRLVLDEGQTLDISGRLRHGELDAVVLALPMQEDNWVQEPLYDEPFYFTAASAHPKSKEKAVRVGDLDGEQVLLLEDGHCLRDQALSVCSSHNAAENTSFRATSIETLRQMVKANAGITLMPKLAIQKTPGVKYLPFLPDVDAVVPQRTVGICWRKSSAREPLLRKLTEKLRQLATEF